MRGGHGGLPARVSTRKVDDLIRALGAEAGISKSEVSRICADLDEEVTTFRDRPLAEVAYTYVFLDATYCKARVNRRVVSQAVVIATGVTADGRREVLGFDVGDSEDGAFWTAFLRGLKARGLGGVQLVISDAHTGLKAAIGAVLIGAAWQRSSANLRCGGMVPLVHLAVGRGPWQRDRTGPAADPSLPTVADLDRPVGVVPQASMWEHLDERPEGSASRGWSAPTGRQHMSPSSRCQLFCVSGVS